MKQDPEADSFDALAITMYWPGLISMKTPDFTDEQSMLITMLSQLFVDAAVALGADQTM
uniref:hypothetical protein n=1 Tax=Salmonella sp. TaxID=599 RepID=UPI001CD91E3E|nr:hypothetical protein [Salmonella sp.]